MDNKMTKRIIGAFAAIILVAAVVLAVYFAMNRQVQKDAEESVLPTTEVGKILAKDLELKYPETPTEVLKLYWRINKCMYNENVGDENFEKLLKQLRMLYDDELLAEENNSYEKMLENFKKDRDSYQEKEQKISDAYNVQSNKTVSVKKLDGRDCATVITSTKKKKKGEKSTKTFEKFMGRRDAKGKWKILGWQQTNAEEAAKAGMK